MEFLNICNVQDVVSKFKIDLRLFIGKQREKFKQKFKFNRDI